MKTSKKREIRRFILKELGEDYLKMYSSLFVGNVSQYGARLAVLDLVLSGIEDEGTLIASRYNYIIMELDYLVNFACNKVERSGYSEVHVKEYGVRHSFYKYIVEELKGVSSNQVLNETEEVVDSIRHVMNWLFVILEDMEEFIDNRIIEIMKEY